MDRYASCGQAGGLSCYRRPTLYDGRLCFHGHQSVCPHGGEGGVTPSPSHNTSTGPISFLGVPHLHPITLPLVPCPFQGGTPSPSHNTFIGPMSYLGGTPVTMVHRSLPLGLPHVFQVGGIPGQVPRSLPGGTPIPRDGVPPSQIGQQREYFLRGRWYVSCVHAGGLSCSFSSFIVQTHCISK